jgi:hypothetical protein
MTVLEGSMELASVFEWFAQESKSIAEQTAEPEQHEKLAKLALLWASAAQQCSGGTPAMQSTACGGTPAMQSTASS